MLGKLLFALLFETAHCQTVYKIQAESHPECYLDVGNKCSLIGCWTNWDFHSLNDGEMNIFWNCDNGVGRYSHKSWYWMGDLLKVHAPGQDGHGFYLERDADEGSGNQIQSDEYNAKIDPNNGDYFHYDYSSDRIWTNIDGQRCNLEWDNDVETFDTEYGAREGREAKFDCDSNGDSVIFV